MSERLQAFRFALDLNQAQTAAAISHVGARRFAYNHMLALVQGTIAQRAAERSYGLSESDLTPALGWSAFTLQGVWNARKASVAPWWAENSKEAYGDACRRLAAALARWAGSRNGTIRGRVGFPKFASRKGRQSVTFSNGAIRVDDARHVILPRIGRIRTFEDTTKLSDFVGGGRARITRATLAFDRGRWFVSFTVRAQISEKGSAHTVQSPIGVDVGVRDLLVAADASGVERRRVAAQRHLAAEIRRLRGLQRKAARQIGPFDPKAQQARQPSAGWRRTQSRVSRVQSRIANRRQDALHKATTDLAWTFSSIAIEDLNVRGLMIRGGARKRGLNRSLFDASLGELGRMLSYKVLWRGGTLTHVDRFYPSSKTCSGCGAVKAKLPLSERLYKCVDCGAQIDRDLNSAINLAQKVNHPAGVPGCNASGATHKTSTVLAAGVEPGTYPGRSVAPLGSDRMGATRMRRNELQTVIVLEQLEAS